MMIMLVKKRKIHWREKIERKNTRTAKNEINGSQNNDNAERREIQLKRKKIDIDRWCTDEINFWNIVKLITGTALSKRRKKSEKLS